ncbi:hypothetical protein WS90_26600 [Burkholderia cepacia]|uniref:Uncharacterized protein n=1 Tax=Burkholderia cepacia TaxID=292 RepID=A0A118KEI1_BURCE|nr:hypothetical protein WS90_26600 [Burkholderia cepacia]
MRTVAFASPTLFWNLGVVAFEVLIRIALDPVTLTLTEHQMHMRLLFTIRSRWRVNRPLICMVISYLLSHELTHKVDALLRRQLARQRDLHFAVRCAVCPFVCVRGEPELLRVMLGPSGHIAGLGRFEYLATFEPIHIPTLP